LGILVTLLLVTDMNLRLFYHIRTINFLMCPDVPSTEG